MCEINNGGISYEESRNQLPYDSRRRTFSSRHRIQRSIAMRKRYAVKALGVLVCLIGAFFMAWGSPVLGENHTGVATVAGILGIGIITTSRKMTT